MPREKTIAAKLWARIEMPAGPDGCWLFLGSKHEDGYGRVWHEGRVWRAHNLAWFIHTGRRPRRNFVRDHTCENRACCNPNHLLEVRQATNVKWTHKRPKRARATVTI